MNRKFFIYFALSLLMWLTLSSVGMTVATWQWWAMGVLWVANTMNSEVK